MDRVLLELRQQHQHLLEMLRHMHEENTQQFNTVLKLIGAEEEELKHEMADQEHWFHQLAFQAAKIYGEEHSLTKHFQETYKLETGKDWDPYAKRETQGETKKSL